MKNRSALIILLPLLTLDFGLWTLDSSAQSVPALINYQGRLSDASGSPLPTLDYQLTFNIYDSTNGGNLIWGPQIFDGMNGVAGHGLKVPVVYGYFNVMLGPTDTNGVSLANAFNDTNRFVEIKVGTNSAIKPRQQILTAPYAFNSAKLAGYDWSSILVSGNNPAQGQIAGSKIQGGGITSNQIAPNTITATQIGSNTIYGAQIVNNSITSEQLAGAIITSNQIINGSISSANIADGQVTQPKLAPRQVLTNTVGVGGVAMSSDTGLLALSLASSGFLTVTQLVATITTTGRPVFLSLMASTNSLSNNNGDGSSLVAYCTACNGTPSPKVILFRGPVPVSQHTLEIQAQANSGAMTCEIPSSSFTWIDFPPSPGTWTYSIQVYNPSPFSGAQLRLHYVVMIAYEL